MATKVEKILQKSQAATIFFTKLLIEDFYYDSSDFNNIFLKLTTEV